MPPETVTLLNFTFSDKKLLYPTKIRCSAGSTDVGASESGTSYPGKWAEFTESGGEEENPSCLKKDAVSVGGNK